MFRALNVDTRHQLEGGKYLYIIKWIPAFNRHQTGAALAFNMLGLFCVVVDMNSGVIASLINRLEKLDRIKGRSISEVFCSAYGVKTLLAECAIANFAKENSGICFWVAHADVALLDSQ